MWGWGDQRKLPLAGLEQKASKRGGEPHRHLEAEALGPRPRGGTWAQHASSCEGAMQTEQRRKNGRT